MISIQDLTFQYPGADRPALNGVSCSIPRGAVALITGPSGSGKSTLLYCINGIIPHIFQGKRTGRIAVDEYDPQSVPLGEFSRRVGTVFQNPDNQLFMSTVWEDVIFGCENAGYAQAQMRERCSSALRETGIEALKEKQISTLSAGQKCRLAVAGVRAAGSSVILFDEPLVNLDRRGRELFFEMIAVLKLNGTTIVITDHDAAVYGSRMDIALHMREGVLGDGHGPAESCGCVSVSYEKPERFSSIPAVILRDVAFGYEKSTMQFTGFNLTVSEGESVAVTGDNGSGKTTLLKVMMGILTPRSGTVTVAGSSVRSIDDVIGKAAILFQNPDDHLFTNTVEDEIMFGPRHFGISCDIDETLRVCGLADKRGVHPHALSRGERQRLAFAALLVMKPRIVILDEPTTGLDRHNWMRLMDTARSLAPGATLVFATHNDEVVQRYATRVIRLEEGRLAADETLIPVIPGFSGAHHRGSL